MKSNHTKLIKEICMCVNNCNPAKCIFTDIRTADKNSLVIDAYDDETNKKLLNISNKLGYMMSDIIEKDDHYLDFTRVK